jgi:plastocyanin
MKKLRLVIGTLVLGVCGVAGYALAAGVGVTLSSTGPQPPTVTVNWGDTVTFSNGDTTEHGVTIPRDEVASPAIPPGGAFEHVFEKRGGNYNFAQLGRRNFSGRVVVQVQGSLTLKVAPTTVVFGKTATFSGKSPYPGKPVIIRGREAGATAEFKTFAEVVAGDDGAFTARIRPVVGARFQARVAADQIASTLVGIDVRPRIGIGLSRRVAPVGTRIVVTGKVAPAGAVLRADLSAFDNERKRWAMLATRAVKRGKVAFTIRAPEGRTRFRISARRGSIAAGYTPVDSPIVRVTGTKPKNK